MKKRIYIAGPISKGDLLTNIQQANAAFRELMRAGFAPLCPHWSVYHGGAFRFRGRPDNIVYAEANVLPAGTTHEDWMGVDLPWVAVSDAVLRLPGVSTGADLETAYAHSRRIPVFTSIENVVRHFAEGRKEDSHMETENAPNPQPEAWGILELMGHVRLAGRISEEEKFGTKLGRIDVPQADGSFVTRFFGGSSIYSLTPVTERVARDAAARCRAAPVNEWDYPKQLPSHEDDVGNLLGPSEYIPHDDGEEDSA